MDKDQLKAEHYTAALSVLSGSFGEDINIHNYEEKVCIAIKVTGYLNRKLTELYSDDEQ